MSNTKSKTASEPAEMAGTLGNQEITDAAIEAARKRHSEDKPLLCRAAAKGLHDAREALTNAKAFAKEVGYKEPEVEGNDYGRVLPETKEVPSVELFEKLFNEGYTHLRHRAWKGNIEAVKKVVKDNPSKFATVMDGAHGYVIRAAANV